jgi:uncharacterized membrane protein
MHTIIGIFDTPRDAQRAMEMVRDSSLSVEDVSVISRTAEQEVRVESGEDVSAGQGATVGAVWGGLVGLASLMIPGVGPVIASGALAAALASALTGAVTGAVVGGVAAALIHFGGLSEDEARQYESLVHAGKTLVAVKAADEDARHVRRILSKAGAESVQGDRAVAVGASPEPVKVAMYDERGQRVDIGDERLTQETSSTSRGVYDLPSSTEKRP